MHQVGDQPRLYTTTHGQPIIKTIPVFLCGTRLAFVASCRVNFRGLTLRLLMSYIHGAPILDVSRSHTTTQHSR